MQKLYCYVDESGQDAGSSFFVVVAVINAYDQEHAKAQLLEIEEKAHTNKLKWHKTKQKRRMHYLNLALDLKIATSKVYAANYKKPIPYFFPMIDILSKAIKSFAQGQYRAHIYIDGIDRKKAKELTNALRASGISLRMIKGIRDESEPCIRLADMWAGCIRGALLGEKDAQELVRRAKENGYLRDFIS